MTGFTDTKDHGFERESAAISKTKQNTNILFVDADRSRYRDLRTLNIQIVTKNYRMKPITLGDLPSINEKNAFFVA